MMIEENNLHEFFDILPIGIWRQGADNKFAWANNAFLQMTGYSLEELLTKETIELVDPSWRQFVMDRNKAILKKDLESPYYFPTKTKSGGKLIVMGIVGRIGSHYYGGYIAPLYIDQEKDAVSGVYNEIYFYRKLRKKVLACYQKSQKPFSLMSVGMDHFKKHRQSLGIHNADKLIRLVGEKIQEAVPEDSLTAHIREGQFNILFEGPINATHKEIAQSLIDSARKEAISNLNLDIHLSIAVIEYNENIHGDLDRKLISHANRAMFRIQAQGGNDIVIGPEP